MSGISWNCQGLGSPRTILELKTLIRSHKPAIIFLMETRLPHHKFGLLKMQLGFCKGFMVERVGLGGGLISLWRDDLDVQLVSYSQGHIDVWVENWIDSGGCFFTGFYGHWHVSHRKHSWSLLRRIGELRSLPWCVIGDFNELLYLSDTTSEVGWRHSQIQQFRAAIDALQLSEITMESSKYTWWNKRTGEFAVRFKLDRGFGNDAFKTLQLHCCILTMLMVTLDHHLLKLDLQPGYPCAPQQKPTRMEPW